MNKERSEAESGIPVLIFMGVAALLTFVIVIAFISGSTSFSPLTNKCILCHNDTGFPEDTDLDGVAAPYKRPHNSTIMCEACHGPYLHNITYIQHDGTYANRTTAAACHDCHVTGISGFTRPVIPPLKHSSSPDSGSIWGSYWNSSSENGSCYYCHGDTKHDTKALGMIKYLLEDPTNIRNGTLDATTWCADCHYNGSVNSYYKGSLWDPAPPLITVNNTGNEKWVNHSHFLAGYMDSNCKSCHPINGSYPARSSRYIHSITGGAVIDECIECHGTNYTGASPSVSLTFVHISAFNESIHQNINTTPPDTLDNNDCWTCHYMKDMSRQNIKKCSDCHALMQQWHGNANITADFSQLW